MSGCSLVYGFPEYINKIKNYLSNIIILQPVTGQSSTIEPIVMLNYNISIQRGVYAIIVNPPGAPVMKIEKSHRTAFRPMQHIYSGQRFDPPHTNNYSQLPRPPMAIQTAAHFAWTPLYTHHLPREAIKSCQQFDCKIKFGNRLDAPGQAANLSAVRPSQTLPTQIHWEKIQTK